MKDNELDKVIELVDSLHKTCKILVDALDTLGKKNTALEARVALLEGGLPRVVGISPGIYQAVNIKSYF